MATIELATPATTDGSAPRPKLSHQSSTEGTAIAANTASATAAASIAAITAVSSALIDVQSIAGRPA